MVEVVASRLIVRFGPWVIDTPLANVAGVEVSGPYSIWKTAGPAHLSMVDRGLTMATNRRRGLCIRFRSPVRGLDPFGWMRHPGLTVTVDLIEDLRSVLSEAVDERELTEMGVGVPGESPWAVLARMGRWPVGVVLAASRYVKLRTSGAVAKSNETSIGTHPVIGDRSRSDAPSPSRRAMAQCTRGSYRVAVRDSNSPPRSSSTGSHLTSIGSPRPRWLCSSAKPLTRAKRSPSRSSW